MIDYGALVDGIVQEIESFLGKSHDMNLALSMKSLKDEEREIFERRLHRLLDSNMPSSYLKTLSKKRLSKFDSLFLLIKARIGAFGVSYGNWATSLFKNIIVESVAKYREEYDVEPFDVDVDSILRSNWLGGNFKSRIWVNCSNLAWNIRTCILRNISLSHGAIKMREEIEGIVLRFKKNMGKFEKTELFHFINLSIIEVLERAKIGEYAIDSNGSDCPVCKSFEGKVFKVKDAISGINLPPFHPNCTRLARGVLNK